MRKCLKYSEKSKFVNYYNNDIRGILACHVQTELLAEKTCS